MRLLLVEDAPTVARSVAQGLTEEGFSVDVAANGEDGLHLASEIAFDIIVLDRMLPKLDGLTVLRRLRARGVRTPVLVLTALGQVGERVEGLDAGADDYLIKPFAFDELLARIEAISRRPRLLSSRSLRVADLEVDLDAREVRRAGTLVELTPKEYAVLEYLMRHQGRVMSRTLITEYAWDYHFDPGTNIVDVVINRLRKKVDAGATQKLVHTVRGVGYVVKG